MSGIQHASNQSIKAFKTSEEYLYAMKEDLAEWLKDLYSIAIDVNNILEVLETGAVLCNHANNVTRVAEDFLRAYGKMPGIPLPTAGVSCVSSAQPSTFLARDNISNFINWCRKQMDIPDVLMFETDDLVLRKNEKNFVLCLLEVARRASRFGMAAPVLIQLEQEIEEEIRQEMDLPQEETPLPKPQRLLSNIQNLDEMVRGLISRCTCPAQFPMIKVSEGKYRVGDSSTLIFVRILRNHVMVRVGGGWDTLEHYLDKHDPCRCTSLSHKLASRPGTPMHEIKARLGPRQDQGQPGVPAALSSPNTLLLSRAQSPLQPVLRSSTGGSTRSTKPAPASTPALCPSPSPLLDPALHPLRCPSPAPVHGRLRERAVTPHRRQRSECRDDSGLTASTRTGRDTTRASPSPRHTSSSLPRTALTSTCTTETPRRKPSTPRPVTPLTLQRATPLQPQQMPDATLNQTFTKSQIVTKLRQSTVPSDSKNSDGHSTPDRQKGQGPQRSHTLVQQPSRQSLASSIKQPAAENSHKSNRTSSRYSSTKGQSVTVDGLPARPFTQIKKSLPGNLGDVASQKKSINAQTANSAIHGTGQHGQTVTQGNVLTSVVEQNCKHNSDQTITTNPSFSSPEKGCLDGRGRTGRRCLFTPPPITPAQEATLYQSLEHEIRSNLKQLSLDSGDESSDGGNSCSGVIEEYNSQHPSRCPTNLSQRCPKRQPTASSMLPADTSQALGIMQQTTGTEYIDTSNERSSSGRLTDELRNRNERLGKVSVEHWVSSLPFNSQVSRLADEIERAEEMQEEMDASLPRSTQVCNSSSWSSLGSSLEATKERTTEFTPNATTKTILSPDKVFSEGEATIKDPDKLRRPRSSSFRQRRSLKKPERIPSIYKLKLKPQIRPRQDHRPDLKPSKIPKPVSYQQDQKCEHTGTGLGQEEWVDNCVSLEKNSTMCTIHNQASSSTQVHCLSAASPFRHPQEREALLCATEELESWV